MKKAWTREDVEKVLLYAQDIISLNTLVNPDEGEEEIEMFIPDEAPSPEEILLKKQVSERIRECMNKCLRPRDAEIIKMRYGFDTDTPMTLEEVGREVGLTRERVRQIEQRALRKLRIMLVKNEITQEDI